MKTSLVRKRIRRGCPGRLRTILRAGLVQATGLAGIVLSASTPSADGTHDPVASCSLPFAEAARVTPRPLAEPVSVESEHFFVSYYTSGPDSVSRPEMPEELLEDLEYAYQVLSTDPRTSMHIPLGTVQTDTGARKILVLVHRIESGNTGLAFYRYPPAGVEVPCTDSCEGYMALNSALVSRKSVRGTATHELMHLFQYVMNGFMSDWAKESSARWAEYFVFPEDRRMVESWAPLVRHTATLWNERFSSTMYSPHFWDFLDSKCGDTVPPKFWKNACGRFLLDALERTLAEYGLGLDETLHEFALWNYYTNERDDGVHYPMEPLPLIQPDASFTSYPVRQGEIAHYAEEAASNYLFFSGSASRENLRIELTGDSAWTAHRQVSWIGTTGPNTHLERRLPELAANELVVPQWHLYDQVAVVVTNGVHEFAARPETLSYTVSALEEGRPVVDLLWKDAWRSVSVTNPGSGGAAIRYRSLGAQHRSRLAIYDTRGRLVKRLVDTFLPEGIHGVYWDGTNEAGEAAPSGMYMLLHHDGPHTTPRKFVLLR